MLDAVDLDRELPRAEYKEVFGGLQERLRALQYELLKAEIATVVLVEGWDAAGKSSTIQRMTERLDPRAFRAWPGAPPSELEQRYHFLWRYQTRLPEDGHIGIFDHSWYGRVLVDRVEKCVKKKEWQAAYEQINEFERWLADDGQVVVKLFFHISKKEQRKRLRKMEKSASERWKVQPEDWRRNRAYDEWLAAAEDMLARTDTPHAPWTIVESTDARWRRVKAFQAVVGRMEAALQRRKQDPAAVSRSHMAEAATRDERQKRDAAELARVRTVAAEAGMPLDPDAGLGGS